MRDLVFGGAGATENDFQVNYASTPEAGAVEAQEAFIIYVPTAQILWALVDGSDLDQITLRIAGTEVDLIG